MISNTVLSGGRIEPFRDMALLILVSAIIPLHQRYIQPAIRYYPALLLSSYSAIIQLFRYYQAILILSSYPAIIKLFRYYPALLLLLSSSHILLSSYSSIIQLSPEVRRVSASWITHELQPLSLPFPHIGRRLQS